LAADDLGLGVFWYLTTHADANPPLVSYLSRPDKYRACDAALFDTLRRLHNEKGDELTLEDIERGNVLPGNTVFYCRPLSTTAIERTSRRIFVVRWKTARRGDVGGTAPRAPSDQGRPARRAPQRIAAFSVLRFAEVDSQIRTNAVGGDTPQTVKPQSAEAADAASPITCGMCQPDRRKEPPPSKFQRGLHAGARSV
jgi:hypothetical protein